MPRSGMPIRSAVSVVALSAGLCLTACSSDSADDAVLPAIVEAVAGSDLPLITLTEEGAGRAGVETAAVASQSPLSVPYSALLYDPNGDTWVYVSPEPLTYTRHPVTVEEIDGDVVLLVAGPPPGTEVVIVGVALLYGAELGIGQ